MKDLKKFVYNGIIIIVLFVGSDLVFGAVMNCVMDKLPNTQTQVARTNHAIKRVTPECLIIGASTSCEHYIPSVIEDFTGMTTYNAGSPGKDFAYMACVLESVISRNVPSVVIFDINSLIIDGRWKDQVGNLRPYKKRDYICDAISKSGGERQRAFLLSNFFCYNNKLPGVLRSYVSPIDNMDGFEPLKATAEEKLNNQLKKSNTSSEPYVDNFEQFYFEDIVRLCNNNGIKLIAVISPTYKGTPIPQEIKDICNDLSLILIDNSVVEGLTGNPSVWHDAGHLSHEGAKEYMKKFCQQINYISI